MPVAPNITCRAICLRGLRYLGITSLNPANPANQPFPIEPTDLDDVLGCLNSAFQEYFRLSPTEVRESNTGSVLNAPTSVTLNVTNTSAVIASFSGYQSWMLGCTIRVGDDTQDNEVTSQTLLARPFLGSSGSAVQATVFGDCVQLDQTVSEVMDPVAIMSPLQTWLGACRSRKDFALCAGFPLVTNPDGSTYNWPFYWIVRKTESRPLWWYLEPAYSSALGFVPRRLRVAPMPNGQYTIGYRIASTATRYQTSDVDTGDHTTDPMTFLPINDADVESSLMKIFVMELSELPTFKNADCLAAVERAYNRAVMKIENIHAMDGGPLTGFYESGGQG